MEVKTKCTQAHRLGGTQRIYNRTQEELKYMSPARPALHGKPKAAGQPLAEQLASAGPTLNCLPKTEQEAKL